MSSPTKLIEYWVDLYPGWQNQLPQGKPCPVCYQPTHPKIDGGRRVRVLVELPCINLPDADETILGFVPLQDAP